MNAAKSTGKKLKMTLTRAQVEHILMEATDHTSDPTADEYFVKTWKGILRSAKQAIDYDDGRPGKAGAT